MIAVEGLEKDFGSVKAVERMAFSACDGQITTLLGGNGSGKTTTLRMIAGAYRPTRGTVRIDGIDMHAHKNAALARLGVLHDDFGLYPRLTVAEHVRFAGSLHGLRGRERETAVERALGALGLADLAGRRAANLSHGERMKVALARSIVHRPKNVLLDEPTRGLDVFSVRVLRELLKRLRSAGTCILMSSHALAEVLELSDRIVVVEAGCAIADDTPAAVIAAAGAADLESAFVTLTAHRRRAAR